MDTLITIAAILGFFAWLGIFSLQSRISKLERQLRQIEEFRRMEEKKLPADIDYAGISGLRLEAREKLKKIRPENFGQAGRISGVSPADISVLMVYMEQHGS